MTYIQRKKTAENPSKQEEVALEFRKCVYRQWREQQKNWFVSEQGLPR